MKRPETLGKSTAIFHQTGVLQPGSPEIRNLPVMQTPGQTPPAQEPGASPQGTK